MEQIMTVKEAERLGVMKELERKKLTYQEAGEILGLSRRQTIRVMKRYQEEGAKGVISKKKGVASPKRYCMKKKIQVVALVREHYEDFGPSFASEKLKEREKNSPSKNEKIKSRRTDPD